MTFLPVVAREMSVLARRKSTYWSRAAASVIALLVMFWLLVVSGSRVPYAQLGGSMFMALSSLCFGFALLVGMRATADCLSEEKREGTLGLLFLTDLTGLDVVAGKLAASSLNAAFAFLGTIPVLSLALLLGGVTLAKFALVTLVLLNTMFLSLALGVLVSALSRNERKAMLACFGAVFLVTLAPFVISFALWSWSWSGRINPGFSERPLLISPLYSFGVLLFPRTTPFDITLLVASVALQQLLAWLCLFAASRILPKCVNDLPSKRFERIRTAFHNYVFGRAEQRKRHRATLLDRNAFLWLASRERVKPRYAWGVLGFFVALLFWVALQFPSMFFDPPIAISIIFLVQFIFKIWLASEVCSRLIEDRRSGALELLLSSPLSVQDVAEGQGLALRRIFRWPILVLILAEFLYAMIAIQMGPPNVSAFDRIMLAVIATTSLLLDLWALKWVGLWLSIFAKSMERVLIATAARVMALPWICLIAIVGVAGAFFYFQDRSLPGELVIGAWWLLGIAFSLGFGFSARLSFFRQFREAASQRFDSPATALSPLEQVALAKKLRIEPEETPSFFRRHWFASGAAAVILVAVLAGWGRQLYWKHRVNVEIARVRAKQLPVNLMELGRYYPPIPAREDAFAMLAKVGYPPAMWPARARTGWNPADFFRRPLGDVDETELERMRAFLKTGESQLQAVHGLATFKKGYLDPSEDAWNFNTKFNGYDTLLCADIQVRYHDGDFSGVISDINGMIDLARLFRQQPGMLAQTFCARLLRSIHRSLEGLAAEHRVEEPVLRALQDRIGTIDDPAILAQTVAVLRAMVLEERAHPKPAFRPAPALVSTADGFLAAIGSPDRLATKVLADFRMAESWSRLSPSARYNQSRFFDNAALSKLHLIGGGAWMFGFSNPVYLQDAFQNDAAITGRIAILNLALAALRYNQRNGAYPERAQALVPEFLASVPEDPFSGTPLILEKSTGRVQVRGSLITAPHHTPAASGADDFIFWLPAKDSAPPSGSYE